MQEYKFGPILPIIIYLCSPLVIAGKITLSLAQRILASSKVTPCFFLFAADLFVLYSNSISKLYHIYLFLQQILLLFSVEPLKPTPSLLIT
ncbi:MAG: hypothetical protein A3G38_04625 [Omnitrophica WOR_2 bacterium RIFCSPLOWO2_12_FULL_51_8]|nr:MAG: hypothetical protein A3G38_04625 [Omnitrophica WOR_2 bacterium RIFCSPLOWO2_12_FULL_51_8]